MPPVGRFLAPWLAIALCLGTEGCRRERAVPGEGEGPQAYVETGDLEAMKTRGVLRAAVAKIDEPALESGSSIDREGLDAFAERHGLAIRWVTATDDAALRQLLREGRADVVFEPLPVETDESVAYTHPVAAATDLLFGREGSALPRSLAELRGRKIYASPAVARRLVERNERERLGAVIVSAMDDEALARDLANGRVTLAAFEGLGLPELLTGDERVVRLFPVSTPRPLAWATRARSTALLTELDRYLVEKALTHHAERTSTGDLDAIRKRGSLRVLTRNTPLTYYLHRGQRFGFDYEYAAMAAKALGVRLEMVVAPSRDELVPWLLAGRGDVIAASFGVSEARSRQVAFSAPYLLYDEVVVQAAGLEKFGSVEALRGRRVAVRPGSSTAELVESLAPRIGKFVTFPLPEESISETLDRVALGEVSFAVLGSHALEVELSMRDDVEAALTLPSDRPRAVAFAVRPGNPQLRAWLDGFVERTYRGLEYNMLRRRYFENRAVMARGREALEVGERLSPYDDLLRRWSDAYGLDWRLMASQAFQESRFDPAARSWMGALGLFQVLPSTGASMGLVQLTDPDVSAQAGIRYMHGLLQRWDASIPLKDRLRFALAAYNAGLGHVLDAQRLAARQGLDPNKWFGHVEKAMLMLEQPRHHRLARNGYCRGREPVRYVSEIQNRYDDWVRLVPP